MHCSFFLNEPLKHTFPGSFNYDVPNCQGWFPLIKQVYFSLQVYNILVFKGSCKNKSNTIIVFGVHINLDNTEMRMKKIQKNHLTLNLTTVVTSWFDVLEYLYRTLYLFKCWGFDAVYSWSCRCTSLLSGTDILVAVSTSVPTCTFEADASASAGFVTLCLWKKVIYHKLLFLLT